jgi:hypothetical protein
VFTGRATITYLNHFQLRSFLGFMPGAEYLRLPTSGGSAWLVQDVVPIGGLGAWYGPPKIGKSYGALQLAEAISTGKKHFLGLPIVQHGPVAFLQIDTPRSVWLERVQKMAAAGYDFSNVYFADNQPFPDESPAEQTPFPFNILHDWQWILKELEKIRAHCGRYPVITFIDTLREMFRGDENDSSVMQNVFAATKQAMAPSGSAAMFIAHGKKPIAGFGDDLVSDIRGSGYIAGAVDCLFHCSKTKIKLTSRALEETIIHCERVRRGLPGEGTWKFDTETQELLEAMQEVISEHPGASLSEWGRQLAAKLPDRFAKLKNGGVDAARQQIDDKKHLLKLPILQGRGE